MACVTQAWVGVGCRAEDADTSAGVLDDGEDVLALPGQGEGLDEVHRQDRLGLGAQEAGPGNPRPLRAGSTPAAVRISHTVDAAIVTPSRASSPWIRR